MLSVFRSNTNNWLMILVFIAITFVFVFTFGSWGGGNISGDLPVAATVNGEVIPMSHFRVQYAQTFRTQTMFRMPTRMIPYLGLATCGCSVITGSAAGAQRTRRRWRWFWPVRGRI